MNKPVPDSADWWRAIAQQCAFDFHQLREVLYAADRDIHEWLRFARRQMAEMPDWEHVPYGPTTAGVAESVAIRTRIAETLRAQRRSGDAPVADCADDPAALTGQEGATREKESSSSPLTAATRRHEEEINATWLAIERGWDIEDREYFEKEAPKNGFGYPLVQAIHHLWKRELKARNGQPLALLSGGAEGVQV